MNSNDLMLVTKLKQYTSPFIPDLNFSNQDSHYLLTNDPLNWKRDQQIVVDLYEQIKQKTPEADNSYWLTRTWTLLCWQPIYIAIVSIYGIKHLPNLDAFIQGREKSEMRGICFLSCLFQTGETPFLIQQAGRQLTRSFKYYQQLLDESYRCRPGYTQALLSDMLLIALQQLKQYSPDYLSADYILKQAELWLEAFNLPPISDHNLVIDPISNEILFTRKSCCFVYKKEKGELCDNCPRIYTNCHSRCKNQHLDW